MGLHYVNWNATSSGLEDKQIFLDAFSWLVGNPEIPKSEKTTSYFGGSIHLITASITSKSQATKSLQKLGKSNLEQIQAELEHRLDEKNCIHLRLDLDALLAGEISLVNRSHRRTVKGTLKLEVYPGNDPYDVAVSTIENAIKESNP